MTIEKFLTPVGRIVWGHPSKSKVQTDPRTKQPKLGKDGQPQQVWSFGLAISKNEFQQLWAAMQQEAATVYPHGVPQGFSWKFKDGDSIDRKGQPYANREGYAGHMVLTVSTTTFAPQVFKFENGAYRQLNENEIKTGDFVRLNLNIKANAPTDPTHTPGLYVNPNGVEFVAYGAEIVNSGADPDEMFNGHPIAQLPAGASTVPLSNAPAGTMPGMQPQPMQQQPVQTGGYAAPIQGQQGFQNAGGVANQQYAQPMSGANPNQHAATAYPSNQQQGYPAPAQDFVQNAGMQQGGFTQPQQQYANPAANQQMQYAAPVQQAPMGQQSGGVNPAYPSNGMPGMPQR